SETKRNELFGTNHTKNTTFNSFSKQSHSDPIMNQLNLFHKWLDRHRDMCEKLNHNEHMLNKLNEEWTMDHNENILNIHPHQLLMIFIKLMMKHII
ncbi:hypothetical protein PFUGPA_00378, partial [Plasmodium falciparum Palo Alto/Uganda]